MASPSLIAEATATKPAPPRPARPVKRPGQRARERRRNLWIYAFLLPTFVLYGMYTLYPMVASYWYSLVEWNGFTADQTFVGLANYQAVLADPMFWSSVRITLLFLLIVAPLRVFGAFALAILLNSPRLPFTSFFRTAYFLPVVTTTAIVGVVMRFILDPASGPVAAVLQLFGAGPVDLLGSSSTALVTSGVIYVWKFFGITMIYWLAALQTIPRDLFEAARIDGAGAGKIFRHITLPMLIPFLLIISVLTIEDCFHAFDLMQSMTAGGPFFSTEIIEIYIYRFAFAATIPQLGFASAAAVLFGVLVLVVVAAQVWATVVSRRLRARA
ncbi:binding-protein-dependent transport systems inner membrane component [Beutenbergia cavernae DSM 12333]|uniref:Binding-protein-dependent transport systems inner membrane component n=1 Tax=Beutenbergia cavernae (strain ATCC BAA-8 / DSM 12333 / CCUG 43141 / JCM 11478 / NBRC 16432 / NCIMB 13614 / HKI 0122) TaxID=471853 RepID=C5C398_BEUC1|nr:sugar ABC transporter permease [Beutenbergia cavernae]ACQ79797.1 binding-protein-dependent transport systems inner membrane component [Beutenbergia cavernae DSM 12333]